MAVPQVNVLHTESFQTLVDSLCDKFRVPANVPPIGKGVSVDITKLGRDEDLVPLSCLREPINTLELVVITPRIL